MYTLETILEKLRAFKPELQRKYPISRLGLFDSYARGEATESSDIDVAVELSGPMGLISWQWQTRLKNSSEPRWMSFQNDRSNQFISLQSKKTYCMSKRTPSVVVGDMRNRLIHAYFGTDLPLVWNTIKNDLPWFIQELKVIQTQLVKGNR